MGNCIKHIYLTCYYGRFWEIRLGYYSNFKIIWFVKQNIHIIDVFTVNNYITVRVCNSGRISISPEEFLLGRT